jgi:hypothetical protein
LPAMVILWPATVSQPPWRPLRENIYRGRRPYAPTAVNVFTVVGA